ncbi:MYCBP-associated protein isoform X2 [Ictalurus furcatus]|uniref:MYCBP-associated protein isoform X2 n=1 Tax=Ictalurus furcatus TaxID=66913 RepID=UPI002350A0D1|nr:MYCBP-associated protein isoform X2 [Ictalurus furcatus]
MESVGKSAKAAKKDSRPPERSAHAHGMFLLYRSNQQRLETDKKTERLNNKIHPCLSQLLKNDVTEGDKKRGTLSEEYLSTMNEEIMMSPTVKGEDISALAIRPEHLEKLRTPQPPKDSQNPRATSRVLVRKTHPRPDDLNTGVKVAMAKLLPKNAVLQPLDYTGPGGPRFDAQGMVLPHSILGSLEDFRKEMEARGEVELIKRIPDVNKQQHFDFEAQKPEERTRSHLRSERDQQRHALNHWCYHMAERRRQQNFISDLLQKPVEDLLMNQANRFRETQEQRELIGRGLPALHYGHGARVGSEFWSVPQRFGDELSGITATLTQTERGHAKPITHITQPQSTRLESGNVLSEHSVSRPWSHSQYLKHRQNELRNVLSDLGFNQPDADGLEIVGSSQPFMSESVECYRKHEQNEEERSEGSHKENEDPLALFDDVMLDVELLPALRISGELARWSGNTTSHQGEVGISVCLTFEAVVGESTSSHLELKNEGSTAIYYSWQKLELPHSFPESRTYTHAQQFFFNTTTAVILPGDTERILFTFKTVHPGIMKEAWKLHTHPVLMGGATLQVTLKGMALYQDKIAEQRAALELELEQRVAMSVCRSVVFDLLHGIRTPERPHSPVELYMTEEEQFNAQNPNLHYHHEPVEALKGLWEQAKVAVSGDVEDGHTHGPVWDLSMGSLHQVVMSLPPGDADTHEESAGLCREEALSQYNVLLLQLHQSQPASVPLTPHEIGLQLWRELLDGLASEALWLRHVLGLPENDNWGDTHYEADSREAPTKEDMTERKAPLINEKEEKKGAANRAATNRPSEEHGQSKNKPKEEEVLGLEKNTKPYSTTTSPNTENVQQQDNINPELQKRYRYTLQRQVYTLMEKMIDSLGDLLEESHQDQENLHNSN